MDRGRGRDGAAHVEGAKDAHIAKDKLRHDGEALGFRHVGTDEEGLNAKKGKSKKKHEDEETTYAMRNNTERNSDDLTADGVRMREDGMDNTGGLSESDESMEDADPELSEGAVRELRAGLLKTGGDAFMYERFNPTLLVLDIFCDITYSHPTQFTGVYLIRLSDGQDEIMAALRSDAMRAATHGALENAIVQLRRFYWPQDPERKWTKPWRVPEEVMFVRELDILELGDTPQMMRIRDENNREIIDRYSDVRATKSEICRLWRGKKGPDYYERSITIEEYEQNMLTLRSRREQERDEAQVATDPEWSRIQGRARKRRREFEERRHPFRAGAPPTATGEQRGGHYTNWARHEGAVGEIGHDEQPRIDQATTQQSTKQLQAPAEVRRPPLTPIGQMPLEDLPGDGGAPSAATADGRHTGRMGLSHFADELTNQRQNQTKYRLTKRQRDMLASDRHMKTAYKSTNCDERFCRDGEKTQPQLIETNHTEFDGLNCERGELDIPWYHTKQKKGHTVNRHDGSSTMSSHHHNLNYR